MAHAKLKVGIGTIVLLFALPFFYYLVLYLRNPQKFEEKNKRMTVAYNANSKAADYGVKEKIPETEYIGSGNPYLGNPEAPVKIVEFADFECPYSKQEFEIIRRIAAKYKDKVYFEYRDFPLITIHSQAFELARAGRCAFEQGKFWEFHDRTYIEYEKGVNLDLNALIRRAGLDEKKFLNCMESGKYKTEVENDLRYAVESGFRGTPTFIVNGYKIEGAVSESMWEKIINANVGS